MTRKGNWLQTFTGKAFFPQDPQPQEITIEDIAHALSHQCRFGGHTREFYSVAQHSVLVARNVPVQDALWGLLHDASEAYLVDLPTPIKRGSSLGDEYRKIECDLMKIICNKFGLPNEMPESVDRADKIVLVTEVRDLMEAPPLPWPDNCRPLSGKIIPWSPEEAKDRFLAIAEQFGIKTDRTIGAKV